MKKSTVGIALAIIGTPLFVAGCNNRKKDCDPNVENCNDGSRTGGRGGGGAFFSGGRRTTGDSSFNSTRGGFGGFGRFFSGGS